MANMIKACEFLTDAGVFYLATVDGNKPKARPLGFKAFVDDKIYFVIGDFKEVYKQLQDNPNAEIVTFNPETNAILRISGQVEFEDNQEVIDTFNKAIPDLAALYEQNGWNAKPFYFKCGVVEFRNMFEVEECFEI